MHRDRDSLVSFVLALVAKLNVFFYVGVGGIISSAIIFSLGLLAVLLRQIMVKSSRHGLDTDDTSVRGSHPTTGAQRSHKSSCLRLLRLRRNSR